MSLSPTTLEGGWGYNGACTSAAVYAHSGWKQLQQACQTLSMGWAHKAALTRGRRDGHAQATVLPSSVLPKRSHGSHPTSGLSTEQGHSTNAQGSDLGFHYL